MIAFDRLAMLALGELPQEEAAAVEEHVLGCDECAARLERMIDLGQGLSALARAGSTGGLLAGEAIVELLEREHLVTRRYRIAPGGQVACTVDAGDVYSAMYLAADTSGARRVDWIYHSPTAGYRVEDVPFHAGGVTFVMPAAYLRTLPTQRKTIRLVAVDDTGERLLGEYVLDHTAYSPER
jgi:hypothetical protein